jgi:selenocysteine lyase/cysteine desulfurase
VVTTWSLTSPKSLQWYLRHANLFAFTFQIPAVIQYLESLAWDAIADHEEKLQAILINYLNSKPGVYQIYGEPVGKIPFLVHVSGRDVSSRLTVA